MKTTRRLVTALSVPLWLAAAVHPLSAQAAGSEATGQSATVAFAERAAVRALRFTQGDATPAGIFAGDALEGTPPSRARHDL